MKPRNKFQKRVVALREKLACVSEAATQWAYKNCITHIALKTKKGIISCLECGHSWQGEKTRAKYCLCPSCKMKLQFADTRKRVFKQEDYFCIVTTCKEFQVLRFLRKMLRQNRTKGEILP